MRNNDLNTPLLQAREMFDSMMRRVNTCIPGRIDSFDPATQTARVTPAIKGRFYADSQATDIQLPPVFNVPLVFPFAATAGFALTLPIQQGNPCLLVFTQRAIDNWHKLGGVQSAETGATGARHHSLNDAFALACAPPLTQVLGSWCEDGIELRNRARTVRVTVRDDGLEFDGPASFLKPVTFHETVEVMGVTTLDAGLTVTGATVFNGSITTSAGVDLTAHKHTDPQGGQTGVPV